MNSDAATPEDDGLASLAGDVGRAKGRWELGRFRWAILLGLLVLFSLFSYLVVSSGSPGERRERPVLLTTLCTITGPFVGAIARNGQSCCVAVSAQIALVCGVVLAIGVVLQLVPLPLRRGRSLVRLGAWTLGWLAWFLGGVVSFLHALN